MGVKGKVLYEFQATQSGKAQRTPGPSDKESGVSRKPEPGNFSIYTFKLREGMIEKLEPRD